MKRLFILASAAALMLASCAKTTVVYNEAPEEISFKQVTNVMTKTTLGDWAKSDMGVYAVKTDEPTNLYLNNAQFAKHGANDYWSGGDGTNPKQYYWPFQGSLDFYVYAPYSANLAFDSSNNKLIAATFTNADYTNDNIYSGASAYNFNCVDLMYGASVVTGSKRDDALPVSLKHALAKVIVNVSASVANAVKITSIVLNDTPATARLDVTYTDSDSDSETPMTGAAVWSNWENTPSLDLTVYENATGTVVTATSTPLGEVLVIPGMDQTSFTVKYKLGDIDTEFTATLDLSSGDNWAVGTKYTYDMYFDADEIKLQPTVADWAEGTTPSVTAGGVSVPAPTPTV